MHVQVCTEKNRFHVDKLISLPVDGLSSPVKCCLLRGGGGGGGRGAQCQLSCCTPFKMHNKFLYLTGLCYNTLFRYIKENTKSLATHQTTEQDTVLHLTANNDGLKALKGIGCKDVFEHLMFPTKILQFVDFFLFFKLYLSTVSHHTKCSPREQCVTLFKQRKKYTQIKISIHTRKCSQMGHFLTS